jgi:hypothetical protein
MMQISYVIGLSSSSFCKHRGFRAIIFVLCDRSFRFQLLAFFGGVVFNVTSNNISVISWQSFHWWRKQEDPENPSEFLTQWSLCPDLRSGRIWKIIALLLFQSRCPKVPIKVCFCMCSDCCSSVFLITRKDKHIAKKEKKTIIHIKIGCKVKKFKFEKKKKNCHEW